MRKWLKDIRTELGLSQAAFAERLRISEAAYSLIERGLRQKKVDVEFVVTVAEAAEKDVLPLIETVIREEYTTR